MTIHTTKADANGNFTINLGSALTSGEKIEVTAQKDNQSKSIIIQAPSEPYVPPELPIESGDTGAENVVESADGKFAVTTSFPNNRVIAASAREAADNDFKNPLRFNNGAKVRFENGIFYVKPNIPSAEADTLSATMYLALRVKRSEILDVAQNIEELIKVTDIGYYDDGGFGLPSDDYQFDNGEFLINYSRIQFFAAVFDNINAAADLDYLYVVIPINLSITDGVYGHLKYNSGSEVLTLKERRKASIFGTVFKIQLDAE